MKYLIGLVTIFAFTTLGWSGGPEIEFDKVHVQNVYSDNEYITFVLIGTCKLFVPIPEEERDSNRNGAKWVSLVINHGFLVIKKQDVIPGHSRYKSWAKYRHSAMEMLGKKIKIQCWDTKTVLQRGRVVRIDCNNAGFWLKDE